MQFVSRGLMVEFQWPMISNCNVGMFTVANFFIVSYLIY